MTLLLHILIASVSLAFTAYMFFRPSAAKLQISAGLIAATVGSGTLLVITAGSHILEACLMGILYLGVTLAATLTAGRKLAAQKTRNQR